MSNLQLKAMIAALKDLGGEHIRTDATHIYLKIKRGSELADKGALHRANEVMREKFNLRIKFILV